jgi:dCMP deaminase
MNDRWKDFFFTLARANARMSKDPSTQVGCVIVRPDKTVASMGFNGFPMGCSDNSLLYDNREEKYARIIHAEMNALLFAREPVKGCAMFVWPALPCDRCMPMVIQAGISKIYYPTMSDDFMGRWKQQVDRAFSMANEASISVVNYDPEFENA